MLKDERKLKMTVAINSLVSTVQPAYSNHIQFFFRLGRSYPNIDVILNNPARMGIDRMRNMSSEICMQKECDYLLFIDDDVLIPFDGLKKLLDLDADIAAGDVLIRGYPFDHMMFQYKDGDKMRLKALADIPKPKGPLKVDAVGFSFCLIKTSLLKKVAPPHFITGPTNTEDIYFCLKAKQEVPSCKIMVDTSITCGHILWSEVINSDVKANYKKYMEKQFPGDCVNPLALQGDRGNDYLQKVKKATQDA